MKTSLVKYVASKNEVAAVPKGRKHLAIALAALADVLQAGLFPFFSEGFISIPDDVVDGVIALLLLVILGFRWRLVFALLAELVPGVALFPTWTAVVLSLPSLPDESGAAAPTLPRSDETIRVVEKT